MSEAATDFTNVGRRAHLASRFLVVSGLFALVVLVGVVGAVSAGSAATPRQTLSDRAAGVPRTAGTGGQDDPRLRASQQHRRYANEEYVRNLARMHGVNVSREYAEVFQVYRVVA